MSGNELLNKAGVAGARAILAHLPVDAFGDTKRLREYAAIWGNVAAGAVLEAVRGDLRKQVLDEVLPPYEADLERVLKERERAEQMADRLSAKIAPASVRGLHTNANDPWQNALEHDHVGEVRKQVAEEIAKAIESAPMSDSSDEAWDTYRDAADIARRAGGAS
jgi:hypothetical protein